MAKSARQGISKTGVSVLVLQGRKRRIEQNGEKRFSLDLGAVLKETWRVLVHWQERAGPSLHSSIAEIRHPC